MDGLEKRSNRPKARQSIAHIPPTSRLDNVDKQNATINLSTARDLQESNEQFSKKRTRGKSLGPGGLEALRETNGNVTKDVPSFQPRSILKPTVPLTPPKSIPSFDELRQKSTRKKSPAKHNNEALLIDFSTPGPSRDGNASMITTTSHNVLDPFSPIKPPGLLGPNDDETEESRLRQEEKKAILERRAARRKSMANRRVSFAPEATLHTWSVMEMVEDSTTSSASNSTRRQSTITAQQTPQRDTQSIFNGSETSETIIAENVEESLVKASPIKQLDSAQKRSRRRSSAMSVELDHSGDEVFSSSPSGDVAAESSPMRVEDSIDSDSDTDGDTAMSMDDMTQNTVQSQGSSSSTRSSLEDRLREAASHAGTRGIEYDEYGDDISMEIANDTVTNAFQPWARGQQHLGQANEDQENVNPFSPAQRANEIQAIEAADDEDVTQDMTMDVTMDITRAVGGILESESPTRKSRRKSVAPRRRSNFSRRQSLAADSNLGDESMDLTTVAGGILSTHAQPEKSDNESSDEELTMEFTTALGGLQNASRRESFQSMMSDENADMDVTTAVGGILAPIEEQAEPQTYLDDDKTTAMEMTKAIGHILSKVSEDPKTMRSLPAVEGHIVKNGSDDVRSSLQVDEDLINSTPKQLTSVTSETGSPSLIAKTRSSARNKSTPRSSARNTPQKLSSIKQQVTPTKQLTPVPSKSKTPERTPISAQVTHRGASPKKLFQSELQAKASPASARKSASRQQDPLFAQDDVTGRQTPRVVLHAPKPHQHMRRRSSGIGIDREGFGSPSVTQLLARRSSIGDAVPQFKLESAKAPQLRFEDPKQIADEIDAERAEEERRESGRFVMEQEANEQQDENATLQLKDMIESMTPKKNKSNKFKGRKSLAVGSARGLLGKRPIELDDGDEDGDSTPKRLKAVSRESSPVKKVHLPKPPSKEETTGRLTKADQKVLQLAGNGNSTPSLGQSPFEPSSAQSPQQLKRYKDITSNNLLERPTSFEDKLDNVVGAIDSSIEHPPSNVEEEKISLQQFLNITNIHFIELNTTKRRHTMAQSIANDLSGDGQSQSESVEACFVAAATTMPLLELYQHATKELKSYISTGRKIIRSIESETLAEQPALFREYVEARPDVKLVMDNQFRNGKTNARLQSKEGWYMWRSQLVDGLHDGLQGIQNDLQKDLVIVEEQATALTEVVPQLTTLRQNLEQELTLSQQRLEELDSVDHQALKAHRQDLRSVDNELQEKITLLASLQQQMSEKEEALSQAAELKDEMQQQIGEADRVREEYRGWSAKDVLAVRGNVNTIRKQSGWSVISAEEDLEEPNDFGVALTLGYKDALRLFFYPSSYLQGDNGTHRRSGRRSQSASGPTAPISLTYAPHSEETNLTKNLPTEQRFLLQLVQSQLQIFSMMPTGSVSASSVLDTTSSGWELAKTLSDEVRLLNLMGITRVSIKGDEKLAIKLILLMADKSRVDVEITLTVSTSEAGNIAISTSANATAMYGNATNILDGSKARKVQTALAKEIESRTLGEGAWLGAVQGFEEWYLSQRQKQHPSAPKPKKSEVAPAEESAPVGSTTPKSPVPVANKTPAVRRSPLAAKKASAVQKKTIPVATSRQEKFKTSLREQQAPVEKTLVEVQETSTGKENVDPFTSATGTFKPPAITPEMQEAMMQRTPIKRVGALRRSPI